MINTNKEFPEDRYKMFISQISEGVYRFELDVPMPLDMDIDAKIDFFYDHAILAECNSAFLKMYGFSDESEIIGKTMLDMHGVRDNPANRNAIRKYFENGYKIENVLTIEPDAKGNKRFFNNNSIGIIENGHLIRSWGTQQDITGQKLDEEELINALKKAEESERIKSNFLANMSHELRTPMVGILGFADALKHEDLLPHQKEMAEIIFDSSSRLMETLNLILDLSKIGTGKFEIHKDLFILNDVIKNSVNLFLPSMEKKCLEFSLFENVNNFKIYSDKKMLSGIINNLLNNAVKYTAEGSISICIDKVILDEIEHAHIKIEDTGIGIPEDKINLIFDEFRQVSEGHGRSFEGTGLGLSLTKKYLNILNGKIDLKSKIGRGTVFNVYIPVSENFSVSKESPSIKTLPGKINYPESEELYSILLVDNDMNTNTLIKYLLKKYYYVDIAVNGIEAVKMTGLKMYDLILMDINLGTGITGIEATKIIREQNGYKNTPIIAITAFAMLGDRDEFLREGCSEYLSKPFSKDDLLSMVKKFLN